MSRSGGFRILLSASGLALCALCALIPANAARARGHAHRHPELPHPTRYKVIYTGSGEYDHEEHWTDQFGSSSGSHKAGFRWKVAYKLLVNPKYGAPVAGGSSRISGGGSWSIEQSQPGDSCSKRGTLDIGRTFPGVITGTWSSGSSNLSVKLPTSTGGPSEQNAVQFRTIGGSSGPGACDTENFWDLFVVDHLDLGLNAVGVPPGPTEARVRLTTADLKRGKVIYRVHNQPLIGQFTPSNCDAEGPPDESGSCRRHFNWNGTVTFVRVKPHKRRRHRHRGHRGHHSHRIY